MTPAASRIRYCAACNARRTHDPDTGVLTHKHLFTDRPARLVEGECAACVAWLQGRAPFKAKRPGES